MVPPGVHVVSYALSSFGSSSADPGAGPSAPPTAFGPPTAFFVLAAPGEAMVRRMDMATETLVAVDDDAARAYARGVSTRPDLDARLAPYDLGSLPTWRALSSRLTADVVRRCEPAGGDVCGSDEGDAFGGDGRGGSTDAEKRLDRAMREARERRSQKSAARRGVAGDGSDPAATIAPEGAGEPGAFEPTAERAGAAGVEGAGRFASRANASFAPPPEIDALGTRPHASPVTPDAAAEPPSSSTAPEAKQLPSPSAAPEAEQALASSHAPTTAPSPSTPLPPAPRSRCFFTPLPRVVRPASSSPAALTLANMDKSASLRELVARAYRGDPGAFVGELQFAFLAFLLGHSAAAFAQWRGMTRLLLSSPDAAAQDDPRGLFRDALDALLAQLSLADGNAGAAADRKGVPGAAPLAAAAPGAEPLSADAPGAAALSSAALFSEIEDDAELRKLARRFLAALEEDAAPADVRCRARALVRALGGGSPRPAEPRARGPGAGSDEDDEDGPTVVDAADLPEGYLDSLV